MLSNISSDAVSKLPLLPKSNGLLENFNVTVPKNIWITSKSFNPLPDHIRSLKLLNPAWNLQIIDDFSMFRFMRKFFKGTRIMWAFDLISDYFPVAKVNIWRLAVLWLNGGLYLDDDRMINTPLEKVYTEYF